MTRRNPDAMQRIAKARPDEPQIVVAVFRVASPLIAETTLSTLRALNTGYRHCEVASFKPLSQWGLDGSARADQTGAPLAPDHGLSDLELPVRAANPAPAPSLVDA